MSGDGGTAPETTGWFAPADNFRFAGRAKKPSQSLFQTMWDKFAHVFIVFLFFIGLIGAAMLFGRDALNGLFVKSDIGAREGRDVGDVVYVMPDGIYCRHMSFDNETSSLTEHTLKRCASGTPASVPRY